MPEIISRRFLSLFRNNKYSLMATLTSELLDLGFDPDKDNMENGLVVSVTKNGDGKRKIIIEKATVQN